MCKSHNNHSSGPLKYMPHFFIISEPSVQQILNLRNLCSSSTTSVFSIRWRASVSCALVQKVLKKNKKTVETFMPKQDRTRYFKLKTISLYFLCLSCFLLAIVNSRFSGFIKGQTRGKLTGCEDNFTLLVLPSVGKFFLQRSSVLIVLPSCENQLPSC